MAGVAGIGALTLGVQGVPAAPLASVTETWPAPVTLSVGFSAAAVANVDPKDARAATDLWGDVFARRRGLDLRSQAVVFDDLQALEAAVQARTVDLVFLLAQEYLEIRARSPLVPIVASTLPRTGQEELILVVRSDAGIAAPRSLRGKRIAIEAALTGMLPVVWLETLLCRDRLVPFEASQLATTEALVEEHARLKARVGRRM